MKREYDETIEDVSNNPEAATGEPQSKTTKTLHQALEELIICPISLQPMRDPVVLTQSGITYDREYLCQSLLHFPTKDPKSNTEYIQQRLEYAPNYTVRAMLTTLLGNDAFEAYDDSNFKIEYESRWEEVMLNIIERCDASSIELPFEVNRFLAERGHAEAQTLLGYRYLLGLGVTKESKMAFAWIYKAAQQEFPPAHYGLGCLYAHGHGIDKNHELAVEWHLKAAQKGFLGSLMELAIAYKKGNGVKRNNDLALEWYQKATEKADEEEKELLEAHWAHASSCTA